MKQATEEELDYTESGVPFVVREFVPEKFAKLIVAECIDVAFDRGDNVDYLKDHFGVES
jgi:hypothetical protein